MLSRYSRIPTMIVFVLAIAALVAYCVYISAQNKPVEIEIGKNAIDVANRITGLNELPNVRVTANEVRIEEAADDTPLPPVRQKLINRPLWKVSYEIDALEHRNKINPHIVGFDAYIDTSTGLMLKIVSRDAPGLPEAYRTGIQVSNQQIASILSRDGFWVPDRLPLTAPNSKFVDKVKGNGIIARHYECYYFLYKQDEVENIPAWLIIRYGTEPYPSLNRFEPEDFRDPQLRPPAIPPPLAERYVRTFELHVIDAMSGKELLAGLVKGANEDTFD